MKNVVVGFLLALCYTLVSSVEFDYSRTVCNSQSLDPTFLDILNFMSPPDITDAIKKAESSDPENKPIFETIRTYLSTRVPVLSVMSIGQWKVQYEKPITTFSFNDIYLLQENYALLNTVCNNFGNTPVVSSFCKCWTGTPFPLKSETHQHNAQWCLIKPSCSDKSLQSGYCNVPADTIRNSCILLDIKGNPPKKDFLSTHIVYSRSVPTLGDWWLSVLEALESEFGFLKEGAMLTHVNSTIVKIFSIIPSFPIVFILGLYVICNARDLAESESVQYLMIALYGLLLALIFLLYVLYRMSEKLIARYGGPVGPFVHIPVLLSMGSYMFTNPYIPNVIFHGFVDFWKSGAPFGIWWLGKAYFTASIGGSFYLTWLFGLFKLETISWHCMHYSIHLIGLVLLAHCTSSNELAFVLTVLGVFPEHISHFCWTTYLMIVTFNQTPSYKHLSGGRMSQEKLAEVSKQHTKKHLAALRQHLQKNPNVLNNMMDRLHESGKDDEMRLIERFADGNYPGVPYTNTNEDDNIRRGNWWLLKSILVASVFVVMAVIFYQ